jgi:hypothetical protein
MTVTWGGVAVVKTIDLQCMEHNALRVLRVAE